MNSKQKRLAVQKPYDEVAGIMAYEAGEMNEEQIIELFQHLVNNGHASTARCLRENGCSPD